MKFGDLAKYKADSQLVISARHESWMAKNSNPSYSWDAVVFAEEQFQAVPRVRKGTVSASSLGSCRRKQQFTYLGLPQLPPTPKLAAIFQTGTFMHIRWQMAGITEGWLPQAEVPVGQNDYNLSGTMDGIAYEGSIVEFKSINSNGFRNVMSFGPKEQHLYQGATYALCTEREKVVFVYEDKDTQEFTEIVKDRDELPLEEVELGTADLWINIENKTLYEPKDACCEGTGYEYAGCPFRKQCLKIRTWEEAEELADSAA